MAVASLVRPGAIPIVRHMMVPKRGSEMKYWYKEAKKVIRTCPDYKLVVDMSATTETVEYHGADEFGVFSVFIARKRNLW